MNARIQIAKLLALCLNETLLYAHHHRVCRFWFSSSSYWLRPLIRSHACNREAGAASHPFFLLIFCLVSASMLCWFLPRVCWILDDGWNIDISINVWRTAFAIRAALFHNVIDRWHRHLLLSYLTFLNLFHMVVFPFSFFRFRFTSIRSSIRPRKLLCPINCCVFSFYPLFFSPLFLFFFCFFPFSSRHLLNSWRLPQHRKETKWKEHAICLILAAPFWIDLLSIAALKIGKRCRFCLFFFLILTRWNQGPSNKLNRYKGGDWGFTRLKWIAFVF